DNGAEPDVPESLAVKPNPKAAPTKGAAKNNQPAAPAAKANSITKFYVEYKDAVTQSGATYEKAQAGTKYDIGGGARLTVLAPTEPLFTRDQMKTGGNLPNANSIVMRLDYGDFSMLLMGDAEEQTEHRMLTKDVNLRAKILKVGHHGSKYA